MVHQVICLRHENIDVDGGDNDDDDQCHTISRVLMTMMTLISCEENETKTINFVRNCKSVSKRDKAAEEELKPLENNRKDQGDAFVWRGQEYSWPASN